MSLAKQEKLNHSLKNRQLCIFFTFGLLLTSSIAFADTQLESEQWGDFESILNHSNEQLLLALGPSYVRRGPANLIPSDDFSPVPYSSTGFISTILVEDQSGVMASMREDVRQWNEMEEYVHYWNLESTGIHDIPDNERRKHHLEKKVWRYLDRRLSEEINNAEEGSTLHTVGRIEDAVTPENTDVNFSENYRLRFRLRPLRGNASVILENPFFDHELYMAANGRVNMMVGRDIPWVDINASVVYHVDRGYAVSELRREFGAHITGKITYYTAGRDSYFENGLSQKDRDEGRFGLYYSRAF